MRGSVLYHTHEFRGKCGVNHNTRLPQKLEALRLLLELSLLFNWLSRGGLSILENEAEKKLGVTLDEVLEIHRDSYLCMLWI